ELQLSIEVAATKNRFDSIQFRKNKLLYENEIITSTELNNSELVAKNSKTNWNNLKMQLEDLKKQLHLNEQLSKTTFSQTRKNNADYLLKSEINGEIFTLLKKKGELITPQTLIGVMGDKNSYKLKLQIDEYDIVKVKLGQAIIVKLDSYKGKIFQAKVTKIIPYMNERSKTFIVEGTFVTPPPTLYPNLSFEATILIHKKENALIIPRELLIDDQFVIDNRGNKKKVTTGLKDYTSIEILSGIKENEILNYPDEK
ncbi:MAG: HlyD family efflux transporter periplasmic adaptor subunit, partial [Crocinitomicaceae bacterium]|nr:HlyD family efflux transporter periplasmic adaptor subunit [Crocinitomicaceae bacterium]